MDFKEIIDKIIFIIKDNAVLLSTVLFIAFMVMWGSRRGFMIKLLSLCSVVVTLLVETKVYPIALSYMSNSEAMQSFLSELGMKLIGGAAGAALGNIGMGETTEGTSISLTDSPLYDVLGLNVLAESAGAAIGDLAAKIVCFIGIFILIRLLVKLLMTLAKGLRRIHLIAWVDGFFGGIFGFFEGIVYIWLFMFIVSGFPTYKFCSFVLTQISRDALLTMLYRQNLIMQFFAGIITAGI